MKTWLGALIFALLVVSSLTDDTSPCLAVDLQLHSVHIDLDECIVVDQLLSTLKSSSPSLSALSIQIQSSDYSDGSLFLQFVLPASVANLTIVNTSLFQFFTSSSSSSPVAQFADTISAYTFSSFVTPTCPSSQSTRACCIRVRGETGCKVILAPAVDIIKLVCFVLSALGCGATVISYLLLPVLRANTFCSLTIQILFGQFVYSVCWSLVIGLIEFGRIKKCSVEVSLIVAVCFGSAAIVAWNVVLAAHTVLSFRFPAWLKWPHLFKVYHAFSWSIVSGACIMKGFREHRTFCLRAEASNALVASNLGIVIVLLAVALLLIIAGLILVYRASEGQNENASVWSRIQALIRSTSFMLLFLFFSIWLVIDNFFPVKSLSLLIIDRLCWIGYAGISVALWFSSPSVKQAIWDYQADDNSDFPLPSGASIELRSNSITSESFIDFVRMDKSSFDDEESS